MRELIGAVVELPVGQSLVLEHHRDLLGGSVDLCFDQLVQAGIHRAQAMSSFMISFVPA